MLLENLSCTTTSYQKTRHIATSDGGNSGPLNNAGNRSGNPIRHPDYHSKQCCIASVCLLPIMTTQIPETAGIFLLGIMDTCRCFACAEDSVHTPLLEHARWFRLCSFVKQEKGEVNLQRLATVAQNGVEEPELEDATKAATDVMELVFSKKAVAMAMDECNSKNLGISSYTIIKVVYDKQEHGETLPEDDPRPVQELDEMSIEALRQENGDLKGKLTCTVCQQRERNIVFLPCGHLLMCIECSDKFTHCPVCSIPIQKKIQIAGS